MKSVFYSFLLVVSGMNAVLRVMLDTNIYGFIAVEKNPADILERIATSNAVVCGSTVIRGELRDTPKKKVVGRRKLRLRLLSSYDLLVSDKRNYDVNELIQKIAAEYNENYKGSSSWKELENDFLIVATASFHGLDLVVSEDEKTMKSAEAIKAYEKVNKKYELRNPEFIGFQAFKESL